MPLPHAGRRTLHHTRKLSFQCYCRDDGLWDIDAELCDIKSQPFDIPGKGLWDTDEPMHHMHLRVTVDTALQVKEVAVAMDHVPHGVCPQAAAPLQRMVGCTLGHGWRKAIEKNLGGGQSCAHLRELLFNVATAGLQGIPGSFDEAQSDKPPSFLGQCRAWDFDGALVKRHHPVFFQWQARQ